MSSLLLTYWRSNRKVRYLVIGAWNTAFGYFAFGFLYLFLKEKTHYLAIGVVAHFLAVTNAFVMQRCVVFRSPSPWLGSFFRFNLVQLFALAWGLGALVVLVEVLHWNPLLSQLMITTVALIANFVIHRKYTFREANNVANNTNWKTYK